MFFDFFHWSDGKSSNMCFFLICLPPGRRLLLTSGMEMGGGTIWGHLGSCWIHFGIVLGPTMPPNYIFQPNINFLEMAHANFVSSIRKPPYQPVFWTKNNKNMFFGSSKKSSYFLNDFWLESGDWRLETEIQIKYKLCYSPSPAVSFLAPTPTQTSPNGALMV